MSQLALPLKLQDHAVFDTFWSAGNEPLVGFLEGLSHAPNGPGCWIWGASSTGKSHLLQAVCDRRGDASVFLPLRDLASVGPAVLDGMAARRFICIDDIHSVAGQQAWEHALFKLFEAATERQSVLIVASVAAPRDTGFAMADLQSRFSLLPAFAVKPLDEPQKQLALKHRARYRGLELPDETARFLAYRSRRDMASLYGLLDTLAAEAVQAGRRLTIPFVKTVMKL